MNLALLRVFGILIAVHELNRLVRLLLQVTMGEHEDSGREPRELEPASVLRHSLLGRRVWLLGAYRVRPFRACRNHD